MVELQSISKKSKIVQAKINIIFDRKMLNSVGGYKSSYKRFKEVLI